MVIARRQILKVLVASMVAILTRSRATAERRVGSFRSLVDVHCHVFNATDLPARRFLKIVFLDHYPEQGTERLLNLEDQDVLDLLLNLFVSVVAGDNTPTAAKEIEVLESRSSADVRSVNADDAGKAVIERTAEFLSGSADSSRARALTTSAQAQLTAAVLKAAGQDPSRSAELSGNEARGVAERAFRSRADVGVYLRWFTTFKRYRYALVDELAQRYRDQGYDVILLTPALIDYSKWLGEEVDSPLNAQVQVMSQIARRPDGVAVHGYVAFDPLREVYFRKGKEPPSDRDGNPTVRPLDLVRAALTEHGFLGVKLYPPMGFRASGNAQGQSYPQAVLDDLGGTVSTELDRALDDLYALCSELSAPILSHTAETNGAGPEYAERADPAYWVPVFERWPKLKVCLAHFGGFRYASVGAPSGSSLPESSWEWTIGRLIRARPSVGVFADLSYLSAVLGSDDKALDALAQTFKSYAGQFDPGLTRLLFGSDWIMLGREQGYASYAEKLVSFLTLRCGFNAEIVSRILVGNAVRFLGLERGGPGRERILAFYRRHGIAETRLPEFGP
jgi:predicted TIM-barrel fold metal-dependent hydrolase